MKLAIKSPTTTLLLSSTLFLLIFLSWNCIESPKSPVAPNWDTQLSIPLVDSLYRVDEAMKSNPAIVKVEPGYQYHPDLFRFTPADIGSQLTLDPPVSNQSFSHQIGKLSVTLPPTYGPDYGATDLISGPLPQNAPQGAIGPIPLPASVSNVQTSQFEFVHFDGGSLSLQIVNTLPIDIDFPNGITVINTGSGETVATFPTASIGALGSTSINATSVLPGVLLKNAITFQGNYHSDGSSGANVTIDAAQGVSLKLGLDQGSADFARAKFGLSIAQDTSFSTYIVDSLTLIKLVSFDKGAFQLNFLNTLAVPLKVHFQINDLLDANNEPFVYDGQLNQSGTPVVIPIDLRNYSIASATGDLINSLHFGFSLQTISFDSSTAITIHSSDQISGSMVASETPFKIHKIEGVSAPISFGINDTVDVPLGRIPYDFTADSLVINSFVMNLHLTAPGHPTDTHAILFGIAKDNTVVSRIDLPDQNFNDMIRFQPDEDYIYTPDNHQVAKFISDFISKQANRIVIIDTGTVNPMSVYNQNPHQIGVLSDTSHVYASLDLSVPLQAGIFNGYLNDTLAINNTSSNGKLVDKNILTSVKQASIYFKITNSIPFGVNLQLLFLDQYGNVILQLPKPGATPIQINAATEINGIHTPQSTPAPIGVRLSNEDAQQFNNTQNIVVKIGLNSGGQVTNFYTTDYVKVIAYTNMVFNVDPDKLKNAK